MTSRFGTYHRRSGGGGRGRAAAEPTSSSSTLKLVAPTSTASATSDEDASNGRPSSSSATLTPYGYSFPKDALRLEPTSERERSAGAGGDRVADDNNRSKALAALCKELTVTPVVAGGAAVAAPPVPSFKLWLESPKRLYVPKYFGLQRFGAPARSTIPDGAVAELRFRGGVRPEQLAPIEAFLRAADDPLTMGGILSLPCGSGKTVIALYIASVIRRKTLIVVHKDFLLQQWKERIDEFLPGAKVGTVKAQKIDVEHKDIVIASLQSLSIKTYDPALFSDVGLLIIDEVHRTGTEVFSRAFHKINVRRSLGLSATVNRKDGMTKVFEWFIGKVVFAVQKRSDTVDVWMRPFFDRDPAYSEEPAIRSYAGDRLNVSRMINNVTAFRPRTELIADFIIDVIRNRSHPDRPRRVLVLSDRKQHLNDVRDVLAGKQQQQQQQRQQDREAEASTPHDASVAAVSSSSSSSSAAAAPITSGMYVGSMKPAELAASQTKDVILATFSFASEGFDVPGLDTLVLASPKSDIEQSVGRILRQKSADRINPPLIFDPYDDFSVFKSQADKRRRFYKRQGYEVRCTEAAADVFFASRGEDNTRTGGGRGGGGGSLPPQQKQTRIRAYDAPPRSGGTEANDGDGTAEEEDDDDDDANKNADAGAVGADSSGSTSTSRTRFLFRDE